MIIKTSKNIIFPNFKKNEDILKENLQIQTYGQRLFRDQTLYEYLLEFLVIFASPKSLGKKDYMDASHQFQFLSQAGENQLFYFPTPRMGLKRFIFLNRSEIEKRFEVDINALEDHREILKGKLTIDSNQQEDFLLNILQDLLYGFNAIIGKRSWFAQSLLPVAPELIFCEAIGKKSDREKLEKNSSFKDIDGKFDFNYRAFMARGGEVYYLHVLQGVQEKPDLKENLEKNLQELITGIPQLSQIAQFIQNSWRHDKIKELDGDQDSFIEKIDYVTKSMEWIPDNYRNRAAFTVQELTNLLSSSINTLEKVEMLSSLIALQVMRMMCLQAQLLLEGKDNAEWLIDVINNPGNQIRKMAVASYEKLEENVFRAVHQANIQNYMDKSVSNKAEEAIYEDASKDTNRLIRKLGKQLGFVVPPKGGSMRFGINEEITKILVLSLVTPGERMLYTTFLDKCYKHFKIIIGPNEAKKHWSENNSLDLTMFNANSEKFQDLLKDSGLLRDLSDSTAIVENPFQE
ncbi:hypothetical protein [Neobacillus ginsengisoli]|uniref:Uncharacterized protein n=1 Tax=Neobacillus ginsengisoli TaxID=904295 RepID=A0ABT9XZZ6_9BACI|nr:hypothetical protein [Neobacillus ginsengisoli]MDQ0201069.1 hypothetical protein [Neobacillus ginsengisoli]